MSDNPEDIVELAQIEEFVKRFPDTSTIIINGGDPLMMPPEYYYGIIDILERLNCPAQISFTTNLWAFYKKPDMWEALFKHSRVEVCTSFQYGNARLKGDLTPFTEEEFIAVSDLMLERIGYRPPFIAVITRENEDSVIKTVELAKRLGVEAKINYAVASGEEVVYKGVRMGNVNAMFTQAEMYKHYLSIYDAGLMEFEYNTKQMVGKLQNANTTCPLARTCDSGIRNLQPGKGYYSCGAFGDDREYGIDFDREMAGEFFTPLAQAFEIDTMKESCYTCPMFSICNGCKKTIADTKRLGLVEGHCKTMKGLAPRIIELNGLKGVVEVTPYLDESVFFRS